MTIEEFIEQRLAEDEALAEKASPGPWEVNDPSYPEYIYDAEQNANISGSRWGGEARIFDCDEDALHIARHDPARVLKEVAAKRRALSRYLNDDDVVMYPVVAAIAAVYSDHPDYQKEWEES